MIRRRASSRPAHGTDNQGDRYSVQLVLSCARYQVPWEGAEARLRAAHERLEERAKEGQDLPRSFGIPRAGARLPKIGAKPHKSLSCS